MYFVYMIKNKRGKLYAGVTEDTEQRVQYHNAKRSARFTKQGDYISVFREKYKTLAEARQQEIQIKKWRRDKKENLIDRFSRGLPTRK